MTALETRKKTLQDAMDKVHAAVANVEKLAIAYANCLSRVEQIEKEQLQEIAWLRSKVRELETNPQVKP